jgi:hypothetical protein
LAELETYREVVAHQEWQHAMAEEVAALKRIVTWDLVPLPLHVTPITCNWVYKVKIHSNGSLERYKALLSATWLVLWRVASNRSKVVTMRRPSLLLLT